MLTPKQLIFTGEQEIEDSEDSENPYDDIITPNSELNKKK